MSKQYGEMDVIALDEQNNVYFHIDAYGIEGVKDDISYIKRAKLKLIGITSEDNSIGFHQCNKSKIWDEMTGYIDELQNENELPDNTLYVVNYYVAPDTETLENLTDYGITKEQIIENVKNQKYVEGASYYTMEQIKQLEELVA